MFYCCDIVLWWIQVRVQSDPEGRLVITGQPEQRDNPWGITAFQKVNPSLFTLEKEPIFDLSKPYIQIISVYFMLHKSWKSPNGSFPSVNFSPYEVVEGSSLLGGKVVSVFNYLKKYSVRNQHWYFICMPSITSLNPSAYRYISPIDTDIYMLVYRSVLNFMTNFQVISLPARIDPLQTSAVVGLHGRLFVRIPFDRSMWSYKFQSFSELVLGYRLAF